MPDSGSHCLPQKPSPPPSSPPTLKLSLLVLRCRPNGAVPPPAVVFAALPCGRKSSSMVSKLSSRTKPDPASTPALVTSPPLPGENFTVAGGCGSSGYGTRQYGHYTHNGLRGENADFDCGAEPQRSLHHLRCPWFPGVVSAGGGTEENATESKGFGGMYRECLCCIPI